MKQISCGNTYMLTENFPGRVLATYSKGKIRKICVKHIELNRTSVNILADREYEWETDKIYLVGYMMYGIPVSKDGRFVFAQQDMKGLLCLDVEDGHIVWKTQSKAEYSHVLVGDKYLCCSKSRDEIQLLNIETGDVVKSYKTPFDNRFEVITDKFIVNHTKSKHWEIISSETLNVVQKIPDNLFWKNRRSIELSYINKT